MSASRPVLRAILISAALLSAAFARADEVQDLLARARRHSAARSCTDGLRVSTPGVFCESVADCRTFCSCACTFDKHKWRADVKNDGSTTCPGAPTTGEGMLPPDSTDLSLLSSAGLTYITFGPNERAAGPALEGLRRLDRRLADSTTRQAYGYTVRVVSCYRPQLEDTEPECGFVLKAQYMLARTADPGQRAYWESKSNPNNLGLARPHAA